MASVIADMSMSSIEKAVGIASANIAQQCLNAGLLDVIQVNCARAPRRGDPLLREPQPNAVELPRDQSHPPVLPGFWPAMM
jgi:hypothetical protein